MIFKVWEKKTSKKPFRFASPRKERIVLVDINPKLKQIAYERLAIIREYNFRLSKPRKPKTKTKVMDRFLAEFSSGILSPNGGESRIQKLSRNTLYNWSEAYRKGGLAALVPRYKTKISTGKAVFRPIARPIEMKFPGRPRRNGKREFVARLSRRWKNPPLECPIRLSIFYSMPIPKKTKMPRRMKMLKQRISHMGNPNLDALNAFVVDSLRGIVFKEHSQIVQLHSEKNFEWWPQVRILIKPLPG